MRKVVVALLSAVALVSGVVTAAPAQAASHTSKSVVGGHTASLRAQDQIAGQIWGIAIAPDGSPAANTTVAADGASHAQALTDSTGYYNFPSLPFGQYTVTFTSTTYLSPAPQQVTLGLSSKSINVNGQLIAPSTVSGVVTDPSGNPIGGVTVQADGGASGSTVTAPDGSYTIGMLAIGSYALSYHLSGYVDPPNQTVTVTANGSALTANAQLVAGATITGQIHDANGVGIAGATVYLDGELYTTTTTDGAGNYQFTVLPTGSYTVAATASGYLDSANIPVTVTTAGSTVAQDVTLNLVSTAIITVQDQRGNNIPNAVVTISGADGTQYATSDGSGNVTFTGLAPGSYSVTATADNYFTAPAATLTVTDYNSTVLFTATVLNPDVITGTITDPTGQPVSGATVHLEGNGVSTSTTTAFDGSFIFDGLVPGQYVVSASSPLYVAPAPAVVTISDYNQGADASLQFIAGSQIHGEITSNETLIAGATVTLDGPVHLETTTDAQGLYNFGVLPVGVYTFNVSKDGYLSPDPATITVSAPGSNITYDGELFAPSTINGTVTDPSGAPIAGVTVYADGATSAWATTDSNGQYSITGLAPGAYAVYYHLDGYLDPQPNLVGIDLYGTTTTADAQLLAPNIIQGTVTDTAATPVPIAGATVTIDGPVFSQTQTGSDGTYSVGMLPPGAYTVTVTAAGYVDSLPYNVGVSGYGTTTTQNVSLDTTSTADILVTDASANPITDATVNISGDGGTFYGTTDSTGHVSIPGLTIGSYTVTGSANGFLDGSVPLTVTANASAPTATVVLQVPNTISGTVTDTSHAAIAGVTVTAVGTDGTRTATTDANGAYSFGDLPPGTYTLSFAIDGYISPLPTDIVVTGYGTANVYDQQLYKVGEVVAPDAPTNVTTTPGDGKVTVSWTAPASNGGVAIYKYTVTTSDSQQTCQTNGTTTSCDVTGLTNGTSYTFSVVATNIAGNSPAATSAAVAPYGVPLAPLYPAATAYNGRVTVSWSAADPNGNPITQYTVTAAPGGRSCQTTTGTSCTVTGLAANTAYTFSVQATNAAGLGAAATVTATTPAPVPAVTHVRSTPSGKGAATITWTAPRTSERIGNYKIEIVINSGGHGVWKVYNHPASSKTSIKITGLKAKTKYWIRITAIPSPAGPALTSSGYAFTTG